MLQDSAYIITPVPPSSDITYITYVTVQPITGGHMSYMPTGTIEASELLHGHMSNVHDAIARVPAEETQAVEALEWWQL